VRRRPRTATSTHCRLLTYNVVHFITTRHFFIRSTHVILTYKCNSYWKAYYYGMKSKSTRLACQIYTSGNVQPFFNLLCVPAYYANVIFPSQKVLSDNCHKILFSFESKYVFSTLLAIRVSSNLFKFLGKQYDSFMKFDCSGLLCKSDKTNAF
jgi:hypothetical protein